MTSIGPKATGARKLWRRTGKNQRAPKALRRVAEIGPPLPLPSALFCKASRALRLHRRLCVLVSPFTPRSPTHNPIKTAAPHAARQIAASPCPLVLSPPLYEDYCINTTNRSLDGPIMLTLSQISSLCVRVNSPGQSSRKASLKRKVWQELTGSYSPRHDDYVIRY